LKWFIGSIRLIRYRNESERRNDHRMSHEETEFDEENDLVRFTISGPVSIADIIRLGDQHFLAHSTNRSIWDLREADLSGIIVNDMPELTRNAREASQTRTAPRTALIVDDEGKRALLKLFRVIAEVGQTNIAYQIVDTVEDALEWVGVATDDQKVEIAS
jgi:hypothetical protein